MNASAKRVVLLDDPYNAPEDGQYMEFRLTYAGPLLATQKDPVTGQADARAAHKHDIRKQFHVQLRRLWEITPFLRGDPVGPWVQFLAGDGMRKGHRVRTKDEIAAMHSHYGWHFVPLVTEQLELICGLDILFLRPDKPGDVIWAGDIDNRLKTLLDALRIPTANERYDQMKPGKDEDEFFCLLEDDKLITKIAVETDQLLQFVSSPPLMTDARLIITVRLRPYELTLGNMPFG